MESLEQLQTRLRQFVAARHWDEFHSPKNLAMALVGEAGELAAEFQWLTQVESTALSPEKLKQVRLEMADVLIYLVRLADVLDVDLAAAATEKMAINDGRYPVDLVRGKAAKYTEYDQDCGSENSKPGR